MAYIDRINPDLAAGRFLFTEDGFVLKDPMLHNPTFRSKRRRTNSSPILRKAATNRTS